MDWTTWRGATCLPDCWCEATRVGQWILEPVNTWTNLIFILSGIYFIVRARSFVNYSNKLTSDMIFPRVYGSGLLIMGLGSFFYHASQTFIGQWFDVFGMYLVSMFYIAYNFYRIDYFDRKTFFSFYLFSCAMLGITIYYWPEGRRYLFGLSLVFTLLQTMWIQFKSDYFLNKKYLIAALVTYIVAQTVWVLDKNKIWCDPYAWMNGHGIWHLLTGTSAILTYFYFQSETKKT